MTHHPIRDAVLHVYQRDEEHDAGPEWIARFWPSKVYPLIFTGSTREEVVANAETLRSEAIEKHETAYINRQAALEKARATRERKKQEQGA